MKNQKDTSKKAHKNKAFPVQHQESVSNYYDVRDHDVYVVLAERSAKLVTALYMVTDFLDVTDPMRSLIRTEITQAMHDLFSTTHAPKHERVEGLSRAHNILYATASYFDVIYYNGFVSQMNHRVISGEITSLRSAIEVQIKKSLPYDRKEDNTRAIKEFSFSDSFFKDNVKEEYENQDQVVFVKDIIQKKTESEKDIQKTSLEKPELTDKPVVKKIKKKVALKRNTDVKDKRHDDILKILKQKKDASINDICSLIKDCSSKTIQRDLAELITKGLVKKEGHRRWSVYNLNY